MHVAHQYLSFVKLSQRFNPPESIIFSLVQSLQRLMQMMLECPRIKFHSQMMKMLKAVGCIHVTLTEPCCEICISKLSNSSINPWLTSQAVTVYSNILTVCAHQSTFSSSTYIWSLLPLGSRALLFGLCFQFKLHIPPFPDTQQATGILTEMNASCCSLCKRTSMENKRVHLFGATIFTSTHLHSMCSSRMHICAKFWAENKRTARWRRHCNKAILTCDKWYPVLFLHHNQHACFAPSNKHFTSLFDSRQLFPSSLYSLLAVCEPNTHWAIQTTFCVEKKIHWCEQVSHSWQKQLNTD
jgi:hypothetical protein